MSEPTPSSRSGAGRFRPGQIIAGKFRVDRILGEGGMGVVLAATHLQLDERVALKFLRSEVADRPELLARFTQEARAAVKLKSEYVARTYDVGVSEGAPYIVMEYLDGHDLGHELAAQGVLPVDVATEYVIQACAGIAEAHARGIVHRDIKPENLFVAQRGDGSSIIKILDFGISILGSGPTSGRMTQNGAIFGSPLYMCPEQLRGKAVDFRADIWSLGAVLFELLAGEPPFGAGDVEVGRLMHRIAHEAPRKLTDLRPTAPPDLDGIIERCLRKEPTERFSSAAELAIALLKYAPKRARVAAERASGVTRLAGLSSEDKLALPPSVPPPPVEPDGSSSRIALADTVELLAPLEPRRRRPLLAIGVALVLAAGALVMFVRSRPSSGFAAPRVEPVVSAPLLPGASYPMLVKPAPPDPPPPVSATGAPPLPATAGSGAPHATARPASVRHAPPPSSTPAPSSRPDLDIHMTR